MTIRGSGCLQFYHEDTDMIVRIITGLLLLGSWLGLLYLNNTPLFSLIALILTLLCSYEFFTMHDEQGGSLLSAIGLTSLPMMILVSNPSNQTLLSVGLITSLLCSALLVITTASCRPPYQQLTIRLTALLYIGFTLPHLVLLFSLPDGALWLAILTAITAASDSGAYFAGRAFGRHKLCPQISPGKTIEGFVGGIISGTICATLLSTYLFPEQCLLTIIVVAALLSALGVAGDLTESIIKRATHSKDSSRLLPGHGGLLDRLDSMIFCAPILYYLLSLKLL